MKLPIQRKLNLGFTAVAVLCAIVGYVGWHGVDLAAEIAGASNEQAQGISQVNHGLGQLDRVTQQNTANAEESAAAAEELSGQAEQLRQMLSHCKANPGQGAETPGAAGIAGTSFYCGC